MLVISPAYPSDYNLHSGHNVVVYPYEMGQSIYDAIPSEYISSIEIIASSGNIAKLIDGEWYGSLHSFQFNNTIIINFFHI